MRLIFHLRLYSYLLEKHLSYQRGRKRAFLLLLLLPRLREAWQGAAFHPIPGPWGLLPAEAEVCAQDPRAPAALSLVHDLCPVPPVRLRGNRSFLDTLTYFFQLQFNALMA